MAKGIPTLKKRPRRASGVMGPPTDRELMFTLMVEMSHIAHDVFRKLGVSPKEQQTAALRARKTRTRLRPSARLMAAINGAGDVLSTWRRDKRYRGSDGSPRVLPIRGKGATLETLARQCVPQVPLKDVLAFICSHGEAIVYQGDRVALLGGPTIITPRTPEVTLAWLLTQIRHVADTCMHNAASPAQMKGVGLFQRQVSGWLSEKAFRRYEKLVRPQLQELCEQLEAGLSLTRRSGSPRDRKDCGVGIFVYRDSGNIG